MNKLKLLTLFTSVATAGMIAFSGAASAADYDRPGNLCVPLAPSTKLAAISDNEALTQEVVNMMNDAIQLASDPGWVDSQSYAFTWASEAKVACGKAFGYLQNNFRDGQYLDKCECFYNRMRAFE